MREFFDTKAGKIVASIATTLAILVAAWVIYVNFGGGGIASAAGQVIFVDSKTGEPFPHTLKAGDSAPIDAPSGGKTGYPSEDCWWTKDGKVRPTPYHVILNVWLNKREPTFCPDCGRLVVAHNPGPVDQSSKAPPTQQEYTKIAADRHDR